VELALVLTSFGFWFVAFCFTSLHFNHISHHSACFFFSLILCAFPLSAFSLYTIAPLSITLFMLTHSSGHIDGYFYMLDCQYGLLWEFPYTVGMFCWIPRWCFRLALLGFRFLLWSSAVFLWHFGCVGFHFLLFISYLIYSVWQVVIVR
jgi:hypothetical protein